MAKNNKENEQAKLNYSSLDAYRQSKAIAVEQEKKKMQEVSTPAIQEKPEEKKPVIPEATKEPEEKPVVPETPKEPDSQTKAEEAKKKLEDYLQSEERKQSAKERAEKQRQDMIAQQLLFGAEAPMVAMEPDMQEEALRAEADYWDNKVKQEADEKLFAANMQEIQNLSGAERTAFENYANNRTFVDPENLEAYKRLKERYGDKLNDLKYTYQRDKEEKAAREMAEKTAAKMDQGGALADTGRNVLSIVANLVGGITGTAGRINEIVNGTGPYQTAAKYTYGDVPSVYGKTVRDKTSEQILAGQDLNISDGISGRELGAIAYQGGMGALDTGARLLASGGNPFIAASMAASQTFSNTVQEATEKGATAQEAYALATVSAGIEALTEKLPLDNLVSIAKGGANPKLIVNLLLQAGVEIGEEEASLIGTTLAEMAILKEKSGYQQSIQKAAAMGVPYEQAVAEADRALLEEAKQTALISGFSGFLSAGGAEAGNRLLGGNQSQQQTAQQPQTVQQEQTPAQTEQTVQEAPEQAQTKPEVPEVPQQEKQKTAPEQALEAPQETNWAEQTFRELDAQRNSDKKRQQKAYEAVKAEERKVNQLEKDIAKAEKKLAETGKGSQARIDQMKQELERQKGIVAQKQRFLDYQDRSYDTNLESAVKTQQDLYENARMQVTLAIADYNDGRISEAQLQDAKNTYNNAGQELYRLKNMTPEQYRMELVSVGLLGDMASRPNAGQNNNVQTAPVQPQPTTAQQTQTTAATPLQKVTDTVTETITGRPAAAPQTSTQQVDTRKNVQMGASNVQQQSTEGGQVKGTGAAQADFSGKPAYNATLSADNAQADRATDVRPMELPRQDINGGNISAVTGDVYGSQNTPDDLAAAMEEPVARGDFSYIRISNDQATQRAQQTIENAGSWTEAAKNFRSDVESGNAGAELSARGALLLNHAAEVYEQAKASGDTQAAQAAKQDWLSTLADVQRLGTNTAQGLQALKIIRNLMPQDKLEFAKAAVRNMARDMKLGNNIQIDDSLLNEYENATTDQQRDEIIEKIQQNVADQIPSTLWDKWNALRYTNMLGNLKTQARNILGNVTNSLIYNIKDAAGAGIEKIANKVTRGKVGRTKTAFVSSEMRKACAEYYDQVKNLISNGGKYGENNSASGDFAQGVMDKRGIFVSDNKVLNAIMKPMEAYRKGTQWAMNNEKFGDAAFGRAAFTRAMAGYLQANGVKPGADLSKVDSALIDKAMVHAVKEAQEATFHDNSALANVMSKLKKNTGFVGEALMPFTKTPANVLTRAEEFSPLGIINTAVLAAQKAAGNTKMADGTGKAAQWAQAGQDITGTDIVNSLAKTLTGAGIFALGAALHGSGLLNGGPDEDEEKAAYDKLNGIQDYSLNVTIDGKQYTYTLDWLTPVAMPMFMGAQFMKLAEEKDLTFADLEKVFTSIADPMLQMSMMQGVNDSLNNIQNAENNLGQFLINAAVNYMTQGLTNTLFGQIEKSTEGERQTTYVDPESNVPQWMQRALGKASQKTPGWDYQQTEYINAKGETEKQPTDLGGILYNMLSPGYAKEVKSDTVSEELYRLDRENIEGNVFPDSPSKQITWTDKRGDVHEDYNLSEEEYATLAKTEGKTAERIKEKVFETDTYKTMTKQQKADIIGIIDDYAREAGRTAALPDYDGMADWMKDITEENEANTIIGKAIVKGFDSAFSDIVDDWNRGNDPAKSIEALDQAYKNYEALSDAERMEIVQDDGSRVGDYIRARNMGVDAETFAELYKKYRDIDGTNKSVNNKAHDWANVLEKAVDNGTLTERQKRRMKADMKFYFNFAADTAKYDQMISSGVGTNLSRKVIEVMDGVGDSNKEKYSAISGISATDETKDAIMKVYMTDFNPKAKKVDTTELKYDYIRQEMGLNPSQFSKAYAINNEGGKWKDRASKMSKQLNISKDKAYDLIQIFEGQKKDMLLDWYKQQ